MAQISETIEDIFGGVSQAPPTQRLPNQFTEQVNHLPIYGKRLGRRPPLLHVAKLSGSYVSPTGTLVHPVVTSSGRRVHLIVTGGSVAAFDALTGVSIPIIAPDGFGYVAGATSLRAASSGDTTLITNPAVTVLRSTLSSPVVKNEALLYVRQGDYSTNYTVTVGGQVYTYTTPDAGATGALAATATDQIAIAILTLMNTDATFTANYYGVRYGSTLYITRKDGTDFLVSATDGIADKGLILIKGSINRFADLPSRARPGFVVQIVGDDNSAFTRYYVRYTTSPNTGGMGVWTEVVQPSGSVALDASTLPYRCSFRGRFVPETAHVDTQRFRPQTQIVGGTFLSPTKWQVSLASDALYPAGCPVSLTVVVGPTTYTYTVGALPETSAQVAVGLLALLAADATYTATLTAPDQITVNRVDNAAFVLRGTLGFSNATTFSTTLPLRTGLVGYTIVNATDGSSGIITGSTTGTISVVALAGGRTNVFNDGDMCYVIASGDYFLFAQGPWTQRVVGDDTTVPFPTIVGKSVTEVFFHQGRLGLVSGSTVVLSRAGKVYSLFRSSATQVLSDDPIDLTNATGDASPFHSAVEWNNALYLFSGVKQYVLSGASGVLTQDAVMLKAMSAYTSSPLVRPVAAGNRLYFVAIKSGFPRVMEYSIKGYEQLHDAIDTGLHIPTYFQGNPLRMVVDESQGFLALLTDGLSQKSLYVYSYRFAEGQKVAGGWSRWDFSGGSIIGIDAYDGSVALVRSFYDGVYLGLLLLDPQARAAYDVFYGSITFGAFTYGTGTPIGVEKIAYLDRRVSSTSPGVSVAFDGTNTTWTLPYSTPLDNSDGTLAIFSEQTLSVVPTTRGSDGAHISAVGDWTTRPVLIGILYTSSLTFSPLYMRDKNGVADERGRLQLRFLRLRYADTSDLTVTVTLPGGRPPVVYTLNAPVGSGTLVVPIQGRNSDTTIVVSNSTPGAGHLVTYDWEGTLHTRERAL